MSLLEDLTRDEGYIATAYKDSLGIWTWGTGRNLEANPLTGAEWKALLDAAEISVSISLAGAQRLLGNGIRDAEQQCASTFTWWPTLDHVRRDAITNLCFNIGLQRLMGFRFMLQAMARGDYETAATELLESRYATQVKGRAQRLADQLRTGIA